jgi:hypothetical protein
MSRASEGAFDATVQPLWEIYAAAEAICDSADVLVCRLVDGRITYVHRRLWPALVKLAGRFQKGRLAKVWNEHTKSGAHRARKSAFPRWVPGDVMREAKALSVPEAEALLSRLPPSGPRKPRGPVR